MYIGHKTRSNGPGKSAKESDLSVKSKKNQDTIKTLFDLDAYLDRQDFVGALTLLRIQQQEAKETFGSSAWRHRLCWMAYCHFQRANYQNALENFDRLITDMKRQSDQLDEDELHLLAEWQLNRACCLYHLGEYEEAEQEALKISEMTLNTSRLSPLTNRLLYLIASQLGRGDKELLVRYQALSRSNRNDQLAMAFGSFLQKNYQESIEIYKRLLLEHRDDLAIQVYLAMCYFHLDYYDVSLELLAVYLHSKPSSFFSINLKACNHYKLYSGEEAEEEFQQFARTFPDHPINKEFRSLTIDQDPTGSQAVYQHNKVLFRQSFHTKAAAIADQTQTSPHTLLQIVNDVLPEAKLNLVIYYVQLEEYQKAFELMEQILENKEEDTYTTTQLILKAILHGVIGERIGSKEHIFLAEKFFHAVGASPTECDTIRGRQSMASYFLLRKEYEEAIVYLRSIAQYLNTNDAFDWNFGLALAASGSKENQLEAEEILLNRINQSNFKSSWVYTSWLARCLLRNNPQKNGFFVWDLYLKMESSQDAFEFLKLIANEFYRLEMFYYAAKAFDVLEKIDQDPEYWEGKRGACIGFFHQLATQLQTQTQNQTQKSSDAMVAEHVEEIFKLLQNSNKTHEQAHEIASILKKWYTTHLNPMINSRSKSNNSSK